MGSPDSDPSEAGHAVLTHQFARCEAVSSDEFPVLRIDTARGKVKASVRKVVEAVRQDGLDRA